MHCLLRKAVPSAVLLHLRLRSNRFEKNADFVPLATTFAHSFLSSLIMQNVADFAGVWKRTCLYEPIGTLGPEEEQLKDVIWVQSRDGAFIDIRYQEGVTDYLRMKSFAGIGSYEPEIARFTWTRKYDFRPPGSPDVGLMRVLKGTTTAPEQLEEDGVLPGDDYREIWDSLSAPAASDCTAILTKTGTNGTITRQGLFLMVGNWFALTLSRPTSSDGAADLETLQQAFSAADNSTITTDAGKNAYLWSYVALMGNATTWEVTHALHPTLRSTVLVPPTDAAIGSHEQQAELDGLFSGGAENGWSWSFVTGSAPDRIQPFVH
jgi:hypothetical protein